MPRIYDHENSTYVHMLDCILARLAFRARTPNQVGLYIRGKGWITLEDVCGWRVDSAKGSPTEEAQPTEATE